MPANLFLLAFAVYGLRGTEGYIRIATLHFMGLGKDNVSGHLMGQRSLKLFRFNDFWGSSEQGGDHCGSVVGFGRLLFYAFVFTFIFIKADAFVFLFGF